MSNFEKTLPPFSFANVSSTGGIGKYSRFTLLFKRVKPTHNRTVLFRFGTTTKGAIQSVPSELFYIRREVLRDL